MDKVVDRRGTRKLPEAYLNYLYSDEGQELAAQNYYRPRNEAIADRHAKNFAAMRLFTVDEVFAAGRRRCKSTSQTAACSTRFTPANKKAIA